MSTAPDHLRAAATQARSVAEASESTSVLSATDAVLFRVRALVRRRLAWLEHLQSAAPNEAAQADPFAALEERDNVEAERRWSESRSVIKAIADAAHSIDEALASDASSTLGRLVSVLGLTRPERDVLHVCLAIELDSTLGQSYAIAQEHGGRGQTTMALVSRLCGWSREERVGAVAPLLRWQVVKALEPAAGEPPPLRVDPHVADFLCGRYTVDSEIATAVVSVEAREPLSSWPIAEVVERLGRGLDKGTALRLVVRGPRGSGRRTLCAAIAKTLGCGLLAIDTSAISDADWPQTYLRAQRQALLFGMLLVWHGENLGRRWPALPSVAPLQFVTGEADLVLPHAPDFLDESLSIPRPTIDERASLFRRFVPMSQAWPADELTGLCERYQVEIGDIVAIGRRGTGTLDEARELCRAATRDRLGELGQLLDCPFKRDDLVVPDSLDERIDEFLFEANDRARFWEGEAARRLFPRGTGLVALMTGPPGTGKTMAAQVIASVLGLDLFRIDLATSISKYIGETAKHLKRIFQRAADMNAVLLFDEADALFTKRTDVRDAHDRYANTDTNYLLQLIEDFTGIALLSSNKKQNMDTAFVRRIRYIFDFPRPTAVERLSLWRRIVRELAGDAPAKELGAGLETLAQVIDASGGQIKLAVLAAMFLSRQEQKPLALDHLTRGMSRELAKEGRGVSQAERERILTHG
jgi:adenylate kinase family enzyme